MTPTVEVFTHNFKVTNYDHAFYQLLKEYCRPLLQMDMVPGAGGRYRPVVKKVFAASPASRKEMRFCISKLEDFWIWFGARGWDKSRFTVYSHELYTPAQLVSKFFPHWEPRDYQIPVIDFCAAPNEPIRVVVVQTGKGKGLISAKAVEKLQHRTAVIVPAMYVEKWYDELKTMYIDVEKRMLMVRGVKQLFGLVTMAKLGQLDHDFLLISATSMQMYLSAWEKEPEYIEERSCKPEEFFKILGVGTKIIDELHKGIHLNVKMDLYTHIPKGLYLTATIKASNPFVNRMTEMAYPLAHRYQGLAYDRYIGVVAMEYRLNNPKALRWLGKRKQYSQTTFEASILRTNRILENYTRMIVELVKDTYLDVREKGQTCLVFAGSIDMCTHLTKALRKAYPKETIGRYVEDDPYSNLMENDIVVSTILSAGMAIDKYGLLTVLMTIGVDSIQANEQTMGRLRRLKDWPDTTPMFFYLVCADIEQHVKYHRSKVELLKDKALYQRYEIIPYRI